MSVADLDAALGGSDRVLLDSSTLIAYHNPEERSHVLARHLLNRVADDHDSIRAYFSVVTATELLIRPIQTAADDFTFMHQFLTTFPHLNVLPIDLTVAVQAATIRATTGIRLPDALVIASGLLAGCEAIVTNDDQWRRRLAPLFGGFQWIYLSSFM